MPKAVSNTSPLLYLHRGGVIHLLAELFEETLVPRAVIQELQIGQIQGYDVPDPGIISGLRIVDPPFIPSEWFTLDIGRGEIAAMAIALDDPGLILLMDDALARRIGEAAGLTIWGTLRILIEAKRAGLIPLVAPHIDQMQSSGMWISDGIRRRILAIAGE